MTPTARLETDLSLSDVEVVGAVADVLAVPRRDESDSFVLHAPLELLARTALLRFVSADQRPRAHGRIMEIAGSFESFGDGVAPPADVAPDSLRDAAAALGRAIDAGDLDDVDSYAAWLGAHARPVDLPSLLADMVVPRLAAAGHAPIFLWLLPRVAPRGEVTGGLLRPLCRELAGAPSWRIGWIDQARTDAAADVFDDPDGLFDALAAVPRLGRPASSFIFPLMSRVDTPEFAGRLLGPLLDVTVADVDAYGASLARVAAWSMLSEPGDEAPYGWSHCLTMPQAVIGVAHACASPARALAVAATHVLGFRASLAHGDIDMSVSSTWLPHGLTLTKAIALGPDAARAAMWHLPVEHHRAAVAELATFAATHADAHLAKYTLACFDAASLDPAASRLYLTAAATLAGWWSAHPDGVEIG